MQRNKQTETGRHTYIVVERVVRYKRLSKRDIWHYESVVREEPVRCAYIVSLTVDNKRLSASTIYKNITITIVVLYRQIQVHKWLGSVVVRASDL